MSKKNVNNSVINFSNRSEKENKIIKRLLLDFAIYENHLKYFDINVLVKQFIESDFFSIEIDYKDIKQRCKEFMFDEYGGC